MRGRETQGSLGLRITLVSMAVMAALAPSPGARPQDDEIRWEPEPFTTTGADGQPLEGMLGRIRVPEKRGAKNGKTIELAFVVFPSTNPDPGPPIFFLAGGPGGSGVEGCVGPATGRMVRLIQFGDVVGIDQRGTGLSRPNLFEGPDSSYALPLDEAITREDVIAGDRKAIAEMVEFWTEQGVDLSAYNSAESADDIDDVRRALGFDQIVTFGSSYGSHLSLAYLRRHAEHVARAVVMRVEGPNHTFKLPSQIQAQLVKLHELVAADPATAESMPDLLGIVGELLETLAEKPIPLTLEEGQAGEVTVTCGPYDLQRWLTSMLADRDELAMLPSRLHPLLLGDWTNLARAAVRHRDGAPFPAMSLMMDCSSGATAERLKRIEREARDPANLLGDAMDAFYPVVCEACGKPDLGDEFRGPLACDVPVLFTSGDLDARTPPENVEEIRGGFSKHAHVLVRNAGHAPREFMLPEFRELLHAFLRGEKVASRTLSLPPLRFQPIQTD